MEIHEFKNISIRGRMAFGIICFEHALKHLNYDFEDWDIILKELWSFTELEFIDEWLYAFAGYTASSILENLSFAEKGFEKVAESEYVILKKLYNKADDLICDLTDILFWLGTTDLYGELVNNSLKTLEELEKIIGLMKVNNISMPLETLFRKFSYSEKGGWGNSFTRDAVFEQ